MFPDSLYPNAAYPGPAFPGPGKGGGPCYSLALSVASGPAGAPVLITVTPSGGPRTGTVSLAVSGGGLATQIDYVFSASSSGLTRPVTPSSAGIVTIRATSPPPLGTDPPAITYRVTSARKKLVLAPARRFR